MSPPNSPIRSDPDTASGHGPQHGLLRELHNPTLLVIATVWWTLHGLLLTGQMLDMTRPDGSEMPWSDALRLGLSSGWLWIPLTMLLLVFVLRCPIEPGRIGRGLAVATAAIILIVILRAGAVAVLNPVIGWYPTLPPFTTMVRTSFLNNVLLLWLMVGAIHGWLYARRAIERERQAERLQARLTQSRLDALSAQLNPHLLFNTLNSIAEMVHRDAAAAERMLVDLGALLRASLEQQCAHRVPLREELRLLRHYLDIEKVRLGDRLRLHWQIQPGIEDVPVPPLLLQPLAENAILHAISTRVRGGSLRVRAERHGERLLLEIGDDGGDGGSGPHHGTGLANLGSRLQCLYGAAQSLQLINDGRGGSIARVLLPCRTEAGPH